MKQGNLLDQSAAATLLVLSLHTRQLFVQDCEPFLFCLIVVSEIFDLRLEVYDAVVRLVVYLLNTAVFTEFVKL